MLEGSSSYELYDSVDIHYAALGGAKMNAEENDPNAAADTQGDEDEKLPAHTNSELIPGVPIFRLPRFYESTERIASLKGFSGTATKKQAAEIAQVDSREAFCSVPALPVVVLTSLRRCVSPA